MSCEMPHTLSPSQSKKKAPSFQQSRYRQDQPHHLAAYGKQPPLSPDPAAGLDFMAAAFWATPITTDLAHGNIDGVATTLGADMLVPSNPKCMVK